MTVHVSVCERCDAHCFPARLRCRRCGGTVFVQRPITEARVAGVTQVLRATGQHPWSWLLELDAAPDVRLIAVSESAPVLGDIVHVLQQDDGAIVASPA